LRGLGGNAALRDASQLCSALADADADRGHRTLISALTTYEKDMLTTGFATVDEAMRNLRVAIRGQPGRVASRAFFSLCGAIPPLGRAVFND